MRGLSRGLPIGGDVLVCEYEETMKGDSKVYDTNIYRPVIIIAK